MTVVLDECKGKRSFELFFLLLTFSFSCCADAGTYPSYNYHATTSTHTIAQFVKLRWTITVVGMVVVCSGSVRSLSFALRRTWIVCVCTCACAKIRMDFDTQVCIPCVPTWPPPPLSCFLSVSSSRRNRVLPSLRYRG